jgi:hypothetical protein
MRSEANGNRPGVGRPTDALDVISILNGEASPALDRRRFVRTSFPDGWCMVGWRRIPCGTDDLHADANQWGVGFVTQDAAGRQDVTLRITAGGQTLRLRGSIVRCREVMPGVVRRAVLLHEEEPRLL